MDHLAIRFFTDSFSMLSAFFKRLSILLSSQKIKTSRIATTNNKNWVMLFQVKTIGSDRSHFFQRGDCVPTRRLRRRRLQNCGEHHRIFYAMFVRYRRTSIEGGCSFSLLFPRTPDGSHPSFEQKVHAAYAYSCKMRLSYLPVRHNLIKVGPAKACVPKNQNIMLSAGHTSSVILVWVSGTF
jgi:hypothetical protein